MELPKLTKNQLEELSKRAEACLVHPYNVNSTTEMGNEERFHLEQDFEKTLDAFREFATPQVVLSLARTALYPSASRPYDLKHDLTN